MPRTARKKSFDSIYHIMVRSISDTPLYKDDSDKIKYLTLVKKYQDIFAFKVYAYCIMDSHAHLIIDAAGSDISRVMHVINQCYAQYFNRRYDRHGHLFQDRFKSKIVDTDRYLVTLSGYIHNNPFDIEEYKGRVQDYEFSSLGIYLGIKKNLFELVEPGFVMQLFGREVKPTRMAYLKFVASCNEEALKEDMELENEKTEYRSERRILVRNFSADKVIGFVAAYTKQNAALVTAKYLKGAREFKALAALVIRCLCDIPQKQVCEIMGNITQSHVSRLCAEGYDLIQSRDEYRDIVKNFLERYAG